MSEKTILVVEDEAIVGFALQESLEKNGYIVPAVIGSGDEVTNAALKYKPDLLLMDIKLNGFLDGIDAIRRLRAVRQIPVIFVTAFSDEKVKSRISQVESSVCLLKPVKEEVLFREIEKVFSTSDLQ